MNIGTLKPLAWHEIMEGYARNKLAESRSSWVMPDYLEEELELFKPPVIIVKDIDEMNRKLEQMRMESIQKPEPPRNE